LNFSNFDYADLRNSSFKNAQFEHTSLHAALTTDPFLLGKSGIAKKDVALLRAELHSISKTF